MFDRHRIQFLEVISFAKSNFLIFLFAELSAMHGTRLAGREGEPRCIRKVPPNFNTNEPSVDFEVSVTQYDRAESAQIEAADHRTESPAMSVLPFDVSIFRPVWYSLSR